MRAALEIARRELFSFFVNPIAYVVVVAWLLWSGVAFGYLCENYAMNASMGGSSNPLSDFFGGTILFYVPLLAIAPALTMRLVADETKSGSLEALVTAPVSETSIVVGKYLAAMVSWLWLWVPTLLYVWLTTRYGRVDAGVVAASYVGVVGIGLYYMALGLLMSTLAPTPIIAFVLTFLALGLLFVLGIGQYFAEGLVEEVLGYVSVWAHMGDFSRGIVDSRYLVYDVTVSMVALFLSVRILEWRRLA
ncbi:MAG: ABC transporter permease subunit [Polyangiales bacterium]